MKLLVKLFTILIIVLSAYYFLYWTVFVSITPKKYYYVSNVVSLLCAFGIAAYVWLQFKNISTSLASCIICNAIVMGSIGFSLGFFGPIFFSPEATQGPLLGIFITGPLGFILGAIGSSVYWVMKNRNTKINKQHGA